MSDGFISNKNVVVTDLNTDRGNAVSDEDRGLQIANDVVSAHENYKTGHDSEAGIMSKFDVGSTVGKLGSTATAVKIEPKDMMTATCNALSAASSVTSMKFPDLTMHKVLASLRRIEEGLDQVLNKAIDFYKTVCIINAVTVSYTHLTLPTILLV